MTWLLLLLLAPPAPACMSSVAGVIGRQLCGQAAAPIHGLERPPHPHNDGGPGYQLDILRVVPAGLSSSSSRASAGGRAGRAGRSPRTACPVMSRLSGAPSASFSRPGKIYIEFISLMGFI